MAIAYVTQEELRTRLGHGNDPLLLDARSHDDYEGSSLKIRGAVRLPSEEIALLGSHLSRDKEIIVYGRFEKEENGQRLVQQLRDLGFEKAYPLAGGFEGWLSAGLEMEPK